jgi:hypothetical protein
MFQGRTLEVNVGQDTTSYRLKTGGGLTIHHEEEEVKLSPEEPFAERPNRNHHVDLKHND